MAVPATASAHPTNAATITRGSLTSQKIFHALGSANRAPGELLAGPRMTAQAMLARSIPVSDKIVISAVLRIVYSKINFTLLKFIWLAAWCAYLAVPAGSRGSGPFYLSLRVLVRITRENARGVERSWAVRGAARRNATYSPSEPGQWTVVGIAQGVGAGEGGLPLPAQARPEARCNSAGELPNRQTGGVFMEDADEAAFGHRRNR
jgi:hypothetical protein